MTVSLGRSYARSSIFLPFMDSNALENSKKNGDASTFFALTLSMIRRIIRIYKVLNRFLRKLFWFSKKILNFKSNTIEKQGIINLSSHSSKSYVDSSWWLRGNLSWESGEDCLSFHYPRNMSSTSFVFHTLRDILSSRFLLLNFFCIVSSSSSVNCKSFMSSWP